MAAGILGEQELNAWSLLRTWGHAVVCVYVLQRAGKRTSSAASLSPCPSPSATGRSSRAVAFSKDSAFLPVNQKPEVAVGRSTKKARHEAENLLRQGGHVSRSHVQEVVKIINSSHRPGNKRSLKTSTLQALATADADTINGINLDLLTLNDSLILKELQKLKVRTLPRMSFPRADPRVGHSA